MMPYTITWCLVVLLHICKSLHGWLVRRQGTMFIVLTKCHLVTNVKKLWMSGRASVFCGFEGVIWNIYWSLCLGQYINLLVAFSLFLSIEGILFVVDYKLFLLIQSHWCVNSSTCMVCYGGKIVFEIVGTIEPTARGCKEGTGNFSKTKNIFRTPTCQYE